MKDYKKEFEAMKAKRASEVAAINKQLADMETEETALQAAIDAAAVKDDFEAYKENTARADFVKRRNQQRRADALDNLEALQAVPLITSEQYFEIMKATFTETEKTEAAEMKKAGKIWQEFKNAFNAIDAAKKAAIALQTEALEMLKADPAELREIKQKTDFYKANRPDTAFEMFRRLIHIAEDPEPGSPYHSKKEYLWRAFKGADPEYWKE